MPSPASSAVLLAALLVAAPGTARADRITQSLNGTWTIADSVGADDVPARFERTVPVPGLVHLATPAFADVDRFDSMELIANRIRAKALPESARIHTPGRSLQARNWFWYSRRFRPEGRRQVAVLQVKKAQFGMAVWLNGVKAGESASCFSAAFFDLTPAIRWDADNELVIRVGAHPGVLPVSYPAGTDFEKLRWTPGIYDDVALALSDNPVVETVQVAPRIAESAVLVETRLRNYGTAAVEASVTHRVRAWPDGSPGQPATATATLAPGASVSVRQQVPVPSARLWTPETPFLYLVETATAGDEVTTRFGMREFRFDTATRRAYLNGQPYFLRGSNITLHRFFEDPLSRALPWDEAWVRRLLVDLPKELHWNTFRFCIGPVPDRWLDIADEAGLLVQNEFFVWTGAPDWDPAYARHWDGQELVRQYGDWMRDNWNHASVAVWDATNESKDAVFGDLVIPAVRGLDLSGRPWENGYNPPHGPEDPVESHPYFTQREGTEAGAPLAIDYLARRTGGSEAGGAPTIARAMIVNEYGWLWLNRDGSPTELTRHIYPKLLGPSSSPEARLSLNAYLLAAETEFLRAHRQYAGVLHFVFLTGSFPGVYTADHFADVERLRLQPAFADYVGEAFKPLGVMLDFWAPTLAPSERRRVTVRLVNDLPRPVSGRLSVGFEHAGVLAGVRSAPFTIGALGATTIELGVAAPDAAGDYLLTAMAAGDGVTDAPTRSRRRVTVK
jgi:hypothetical protein